MIQKKVKINSAAKIILFLSFFILNQTSFAAMAGKSDFNVLDDSMRDAQIIIGTAAGGAILGLSTLSFVDVPEEHLKSVVVGAAIGIILGVGIVVYQQAGKSQELYLKNAGKQSSAAPATFTTPLRMAWHKSEMEREILSDQTTRNTIFVHSFSF
ncbi:MAG TPA: hypothetical protein VI754_12635 [Bacteriovoracaceae bacterium]|nr:hypothetical protein [Bacteriovoracaceae bacterium]